MKAIHVLPLAALVALAGCTGGEPDANETTPAPMPTATVTVTPTPEPTPTPTETVAANTFPAAFQGRWGMVPNDCQTGRADNKGLMTVSAREVRFYESAADVRSITIESPTQLSGEFDFSGEGQEWQRRMVFALGADGTSLVRTEKDPDLSLTYKKCP